MTKADLVELVFDTIKGTLAQGQKIKISGFGNFIVREKRSRVGRNPQTGESIEISARRVLTFRPSQVLRAEVDAVVQRPRQFTDPLACGFVVQSAAAECPRNGGHRHASQGRNIVHPRHLGSPHSILAPGL